MRIGVDAMGGDFAPGVVVEGVAQALVAMTDQNYVQIGKIDQCLCHAFNNDTGSEIAPHCIHADSHIYRVRVLRSDRPLTLQP